MPCFHLLSINNEFNVLNDNLGGKQNASTAINISNIGNQSVNYANSANYATSAGNADTVDGYHSYDFVGISDGLKIRGLTNNANWALSPGIYTTNLNTVDASDYGLILLISNGTSFNGSTWFFQIWFRTSGGVFVRRSINATGGGEWTNWVALI